jgi:hypothetical protein
MSPRLEGEQARLGLGDEVAVAGRFSLARMPSASLAVTPEPSPRHTPLARIAPVALRAR